MAYESTGVPIARSQEGIRQLVMRRGGGKLAFISDPPREGFEAIVVIETQPYRIRLLGECKLLAPTRKKVRHYRGRVASSIEVETTADEHADHYEQECKRIWRVLFYHLKSVFEAADSGVMEFRELILPYIVTNNNKTIAEQLLPHLDKAIQSNPNRLLNQ
jgi:hypothetical protein